MEDVVWSRSSFSSVTAPVTSVSFGTFTAPNAPESINGLSGVFAGMSWLDTITAVVSAPVPFLTLFV